MSSAVLVHLLESLDGALSVTDGAVSVADSAKLRSSARQLAERSAFGAGAERGYAQWLIWEAALASGIIPSSIHELYMARGRGETPSNFTVPAMNLRAAAFDCARAAFRAARKLDAGAIIFEIARSEMGYTDQRPSEYASSVLAAAIAEDFRGPVFIQGDHLQVSAKKYAADPEAEVQGVRDLITEAVKAGFYNIDIDTSTLVDLSRPTVPDQQSVNTGRCAELASHVRALEPEGITISTGGEIGEVGGKNSTEEELRAFMDGYSTELARRSAGMSGLSKISIQTGTSHGGVVLPDGTMAQVAVDFDTLGRLSRVAREEYHLAGAVQHGASTLPEAAFRKFADAAACEVHLATNFQNMLYDRLPAGLRAEMYAWLRVNAADERKAKDTEEQFLYKTRKKAIGPFKSQLWGLPADVQGEVEAAWEKQFAFLFEQLNVGGTRELARQHTTLVPLHKRPSHYLGDAAEAEVPSDLAD